VVYTTSLSRIDMQYARRILIDTFTVLVDVPLVVCIFRRTSKHNGVFIFNPSFIIIILYYRRIICSDIIGKLCIERSVAVQFRSIGID